ncbi:MAG: TrmB family transcriptional regulator [Candidatus Methanofastidiosia archaeon]
MNDILKLLRKIGLTEYEAKVYLTLINKHMDGATKLSEESKVPRTKIYSVLESLEQKGWIKIYSGIPLLFRPNHPREIFERMKEDYNKFLDSISMEINSEVGDMIEKFVVSRYNIGIGNLRKEIKKARTIWISNATAELLEELRDTFSEEAEIKVLLFPKEKKIAHKNIQYKEALVKIVNIVKTKETPSTSIILDEERIFTVFKDPTKGKYMVSEMLYEDCTNCFREWNYFGWSTSKEV